MSLSSKLSTPPQAMAVLDIYHYDMVLVNLEPPIKGIIKSVLFYV